MCTGAEIAMMAMSGAGSLMEMDASQRREQAMADASNQRLTEFLDRNAGRTNDATALFENRKDAVDPAAVTDQQAAATDTRSAALSSAVDNTVTPDIPLAGSAPKMIGDVMRGAEDKARADSKTRSNALATAGGFGDMLFGQQLGTADAGRKISTIAGLSQSDAAMLPQYQDLAMHQAAADNPPSMFGSLLRGLGIGGGYYFGGRATD